MERKKKMIMLAEEMLRLAIAAGEEYAEPFGELVLYLKEAPEPLPQPRVMIDKRIDLIA